jgi:hypothetical protein
MPYLEGYCSVGLQVQTLPQRCQLPCHWAGCRAKHIGQLIPANMNKAVENVGPY